MIDVLFPYSYVAISFGLLLGIGLTTMVLGSISAVALLVFLYIGVIRIKPLLELFTTAITRLLPNQYHRIQTNIKESFKVRFTTTIDDGKYIYAWHPHGIISMSHFFHIASRLTDWPSHLRSIRIVALYYLQWLPFGQELFEYSNAIPSQYHPMKQALHDGHSISVSLGGMREMLGNTYIVRKRRGIFKMALETGTPIIPVVSFGEQQLFTLLPVYPSIQKWLEPYDICICIPTCSSILKWLGMLQHPLKDPLTSVVGAPIPVLQILEPTEDDIAALRDTYIEALKDLFTKENPNKHEQVLIV